MSASREGSEISGAPEVSVGYATHYATPTAGGDCAIQAQSIAHAPIEVDLEDLTDWILLDLCDVGLRSSIFLNKPGEPVFFGADEQRTRAVNDTNSKKQGTVVPLGKRQPKAALVDRDDDQLMLLAAVGSKPAFGVIADRYLVKVANYCAKLTGNLDAAEALSQEVFLEAWRSRRRYEAQGRFKVFLFTIARNRCRNHRRSVQRRFFWLPSESELVDADLLASREPDQLDAVIDAERRRRVRIAVTRLPGKFREVLLLRFDQELEYPEIAAILDRPEATIRSRVFHGLKKLRSRLGGVDHA